MSSLTFKLLSNSIQYRPAFSVTIHRTCWCIERFFICAAVSELDEPAHPSEMENHLHMTWYALLYSMILSTLIFCCLDCTVPRPIATHLYQRTAIQVSEHGCISVLHHGPNSELEQVTSLVSRSPGRLQHHSDPPFQSACHVRTL
jgi:hypothetical protein